MRPYTSTEAALQVARWGSTRWGAVKTALRCLEDEAELDIQQSEPEPEPPPPPPPSDRERVQGYADGCASRTLLGNIYDYSRETEKGRLHVERWNRVLRTLTGEDFGEDGPMPASEAQGYANRGWSRWALVATALQCVENASGPRDPPQTETQQTQQSDQDEGDSPLNDAPPP